MRKVIQVGRKSKREGGEALRMAEQIDSRVELIQALIPLGLDAVKNLLQRVEGGEALRMAEQGPCGRAVSERGSACRTGALGETEGIGLSGRSEVTDPGSPGSG